MTGQTHTASKICYRSMSDRWVQTFSGRTDSCWAFFQTGNSEKHCHQVEDLLIRLWSMADTVLSARYWTNDSERVSIPCIYSLILCKHSMSACSWFMIYIMNDYISFHLFVFHYTWLYIIIYHCMSLRIITYHYICIRCLLARGPWGFQPLWILLFLITYSFSSCPL